MDDGPRKEEPEAAGGQRVQHLVKAAAEVIRHHEEALHAAMHKQFDVVTDAGRMLLTLDIMPDEFDPHALHGAQDEVDELIAQVRVRPDFKLSKTGATARAEADYRKP